MLHDRRPPRLEPPRAAALLRAHPSNSRPYARAARACARTCACCAGRLGRLGRLGRVVHEERPPSCARPFSRRAGGLPWPAARGATTAARAHLDRCRLARCTCSAASLPGHLTGCLACRLACRLAGRLAAHLRHVPEHEGAAAAHLVRARVSVGARVRHATTLLPLTAQNTPHTSTRAHKRTHAHTHIYHIYTLLTT